MLRGLALGGKGFAAHHFSQRLRTEYFFGWNKFPVADTDFLGSENEFPLQIQILGFHN